MDIVTARPDQTLLPALQELLDGAREALLAVAFIDTKGVHLIEKELKTVGLVRVLATSQFDKLQHKTDIAFERMTGFGAEARLFNPNGGTTFHPKMYLARRDNTFRGVVGSANLTFGLAGNYETCVVLEGKAARDAWVLGEGLWNHPAALSWKSKGPVRPDELEPRLYRLLSTYVHPGMTIKTLGRAPKDNTILALARTGATVATTDSPGGAFVEPRMIQIGYDALVTSPTGQLKNTDLLNKLRVHRSSFVVALLSQLPMVRPVSRDPITIELTGPPPVPASSRVG